MSDVYARLSKTEQEAARWLCVLLCLEKARRPSLPLGIWVAQFAGTYLGSAAAGAADLYRAVDGRAAMLDRSVERLHDDEAPESYDPPGTDEAGACHR